MSLRLTNFDLTDFMDVGQNKAHGFHLTLFVRTVFDLTFFKGSVIMIEEAFACETVRSPHGFYRQVSFASRILGFASRFLKKNRRKVPKIGKICPI